MRNLFVLIHLYIWRDRWLTEDGSNLCDSIERVNHSRAQLPERPGKRDSARDGAGDWRV